MASVWPFYLSVIVPEEAVGLPAACSYACRKNIMIDPRHFRSRRTVFWPITSRYGNKSAQAEPLNDQACPSPPLTPHRNESRLSVLTLTTARVWHCPCFMRFDTNTTKTTIQHTMICSPSYGRNQSSSSSRYTNSPAAFSSRLFPG
jgi:hypothetical protein